MTHNITWLKLTKYSGITKNVKFGYTTGMLSLQIPPTYASALPTLITRFMGPTWGPPGSCRPQMGPMLVPWILLSGHAVGRGWNVGNPLWAQTRFVDCYGCCMIKVRDNISLTLKIGMVWRHNGTLPDFRCHQRRFTVALSRVCKTVRWFSDVVVDPNFFFLASVNVSNNIIFLSPCSVFLLSSLPFCPTIVRVINTNHQLHYYNYFQSV